MAESGWTLDTWIAHSQALAAERDRRYAEVDIEREKALKIKETADLAALTLASENQRLRDEAHNGLLQQWQGDRGHFVTDEKFEATVKPLTDYVASQRGQRTGALDARSLLFAILALVVTVAAIIGPHIH